MDTPEKWKKTKNDRQSKTEYKIDKTEADRPGRETETVGTPANLIMSGCELDSLTDGPGARL